MRRREEGIGIEFTARLLRINAELEALRGAVVEIHRHLSEGAGDLLRQAAPSEEFLRAYV